MASKKLYRWVATRESCNVGAYNADYEQEVSKGRFIHKTAKKALAAYNKKYPNGRWSSRYNMSSARVYAERQDEY